MKIAFVSCVDPIDDRNQDVWEKVINHSPNVLLLMGDNVYIDFGYSWYSDHPLYCSQGWSDQRFADELYRRYLLQSEVSSFRSLVSNVPTIGATWDDHDFAWNNSHGKGNGENHVPQTKRLISKSLYLQFSNWLNSDQLPTSYPDQPVINELTNTEDSGIEKIIDVENVRIILTDGRYYREEKKKNGESSILGDDQRQWLDTGLSSWDGIKVMCTGTTLSRGGEGWDQFSDLSWLAQRDLERTVVLSGDIHRNAFKKHKYLGGIYEVTSSGAARPKLGGDSGNYGILEVQGAEAVASLYDSEGEVTTRKIISET